MVQDRVMVTTDS